MTLSWRHAGRFGVRLWLAASLGAGVLGIALLADAAVRAAVKDRVIALDAALFEGGLRRLYHGEPLPHIPESLPAPPVNAYDWLGQEDFLPIAHGLGPVLYAGANTLGTFER